MLVTEVIKAKREFKELKPEEIQFFIDGFTKGQIPDYQMASLLMAIFLNGMTEQETISLTQTMLDSGERVIFDSNIFPVDKHSTGGVGDKTSLILAPLVGACGVPVPMMSGRGLGHTGGTLDKLEAIPGFNVFLPLDEFKKQTLSLGLCFIGQTENICPADKKIYSLRDVTATVESLPLICASIMSKKIAEGIRGLVLDVKYGSGAFMKTPEQARQLAKGLISIGQGHNLKTQALITNMNQPLGRFVGNSVEVGECLAILKRSDYLGYNYKAFQDTETLSVELATSMVALGKKISLEDAKQEVLNVLNSGKAFELFEKVVSVQGGDLSQRQEPSQVYCLTPKTKGYLYSINTEAIGLAGICLGAGRRLVTDKINPTAGIEVCAKLGDKLDTDTPLFKVHTDGNSNGLIEAQKILETSYELSAEKPSTPSLILERL